MKKPQILILGLVYGFLSVYRLLGSDLTNVKGTVAIASCAHNAARHFPLDTIRIFVLISTCENS